MLTDLIALKLSEMGAISALSLCDAAINAFLRPILPFQNILAHHRP